MATVRDIVERAYRKIGVVAMEEPMEDDIGQAGLDAFNDMLHGWKPRGVDVTHTDLTLNSTFPLADQWREGTVYILASRLSPDFMVPQAFDADDWFRTLQAAYMTISAATMPAATIYTPSRAARDGTLSNDF